MRNVRPLLVALLLVPGVVIGIWIGYGQRARDGPAKPPADAVQQAQTPQAVPSTRPEQQKTPHDQQDPGKNAPSAAAHGDAARQGAGDSASTSPATRSTRSGRCRPSRRS